MIDFPANPTNGQSYAAPNGPTYRFDGTAWNVVASQTPTGNVVRKIITTSGTYTKPAGLRFLDVLCVGGGGGGGYSRSAASSGSAGTGGSSGAAARSLIDAANLAASVAMTIGAGGARGVGSTPANPGAGGTTSFGAAVIAGGGPAGLMLSTTVGPAIGQTPAGGIASAGDLQMQGAPPPSFPMVINQSVHAPSGGGNSILAGGGRGWIEGSGEDGAFGSGGGGSSSSGGGQRNGGFGGAGVIILEEYY